MGGRAGVGRGGGGAEIAPSSTAGRSSPWRTRATALDSREVGGPRRDPGGPDLTDADTAATIRNLYGTRRFANVVVEGEPAEAGGVAVTVHLWRAYRVSRISFKGKSSLSAEDLRRAVPFAPGDPFSASALEAGTAAIERRLGTEGYLHPAVEPDAVFDPVTFDVTVIYVLAAGERARTTALFFDGADGPFRPGGPGEEGKVRRGSATARRRPAPSPSACGSSSWERGTSEPRPSSSPPSPRTAGGSARCTGSASGRATRSRSRA